MLYYKYAGNINVSQTIVVTNTDEMFQLPVVEIKVSAFTGCGQNVDRKDDWDCIRANQPEGANPLGQCYNSEINTYRPTVGTHQYTHSLNNTCIEYIHKFRLENKVWKLQGMRCCAASQRFKKYFSELQGQQVRVKLGSVWLLEHSMPTQQNTLF